MQAHAILDITHSKPHSCPASTRSLTSFAPRRMVAGAEGLSQALCDGAELHAFDRTHVPKLCIRRVSAVIVSENSDEVLLNFSRLTRIDPKEFCPLFLKVMQVMDCEAQSGDETIENSVADATADKTSDPAHLASLDVHFLVD